MDIFELKKVFAHLFGESDETIRVFESPGRVNLIGEHIDYCGGPVLPVALSMKTTLLARKRNDRILRLKATDLDGVVETTLDEIESLKGTLPWGDYPLGVALIMQNAGFDLCGCDLLYHDEVPHGCGLSSSAAVEVATALALSSLSGTNADKVTIAKLSQKAEHEFIGVKCGIMDQFASAMGKAGHAIFLQCDTLEYQYVPLLLAGHKIVIINTNVKHSLGNSAYNNRRATCEEGFELLKKVVPDVDTLADVDDVDLEEYQSVLTDDIIRRRVTHVVSECERVQYSRLALKLDDLSWFGRLMYESHASLRDDFEVSCPELDLIVAECQKVNGVLGARMTGGGFGGCAIALVQEEKVNELINHISYIYEKTFKHNAFFYIAEASDGCREVLGGLR